jgi:ATPase family associated with various cellular activities (AAA)
MQVGTLEPVVARETLWTYRGVDEEAGEKDFFMALDTMVAGEIARRSQAERHIWVGREMHLQIGSYTVQARLTNVEPLLATVVSETTHTIAQYRERAKDEGLDVSTFLAEIIRYPNQPLGAMFESLVGLDEIKEGLFRKLALLINPGYIETWIAGSYPVNPPQMLMQVLRDRYPLIVLEGEVGSGKTALARSIGDRLATRLHTALVLFIVNAQVRGGGHVGELTQNISRAFTEAERCQEREQIPVLLLIDEADALAQARGGNQTHHEDDAGVNTLIQCIDRLRGRPMAVIFGTNLSQSLDAAILRRAIASYHFDRPTAEQRAEVFRRLLVNTSVDVLSIARLVELTEARRLQGFGEAAHRYTYSDLSQRIIPQAVEAAVYAQQPLSLEHLCRACQITPPTPEARRSADTKSK